MGVTGIWEHMQKYADTVDIDRLRNKVLAIDGHVWLFESSKGCSAHGLSGASYLVTFFNRCQRLREHGIEPIVVFDHVVFTPEDQSQSSHHTQIKKSRRSGGNGWNLNVFNDLSKRVMNVKTLLGHMGIRCILGGADGEAQCAQLEEAGLVDGCVTPDFDYFLYGGKNLYKIEFTNGGRSVKKDVVHISIQQLENMNLNRYRLVALAMLVGCDYLEGGVTGVGTVTALEILSEFTLHEDDHSISILDRFASYCREELPVRSSDSKQKRKLRKAKIGIPDGFPNTDIFVETARVFLVPQVQNFDKDSLPSRKEPDMKSVSDILERECNWKPLKITKELSKSDARTKTAKKAAQQTHISDFFSSTRRRRTPVVVECTPEERMKCSQREWAALQRLKSKAELYAISTSSVGEITPEKEPPKKTISRARKRPRKLPFLEDDTTPTTSTPKRRLNVNNDVITFSDTSSIIVLD